MSSSRKGGLSWRIFAGEILGVSVNIHASLIIVAAWAMIGQFMAQTTGLQNLTLLVMLGAALLAHELGHCLAALVAGVRPKEITIYPFGGTARWDKAPSPKSELLILLSGPAASLALAAACLPFFRLTAESLFSGSFGAAEKFFVINALLAAINFLPNPPLDGGRMFRCLLNIGYCANSSDIALRVAQLSAAGLGLIGLILGWPLLVLAGIFLFTSAMRESFVEMGRRAALGKTARDGMTPKEHLQAFTHGTTIGAALPLAVKSFQNFFPVIYGEDVLGVVEKDDLIQFAAVEPQDAYIAEVMDRDFPRASADSPLGACLDQIENTGGLPLVIIDEKGFAGMLFKERVIEYLLVSDLSSRPKAADFSSEELL